ncbi:hypothetical protein B0J14DRAFT_308199 [Halenospora varia]|nr:hypothetical protein B0J14DRAFT_308199 [Halenospora varia]
MGVTASEEDVKKLIELRIATANHMSGLIDKDLRKYIMESILANFRGGFLLPALQIDYILEQTTVKQIRQTLSGLPHTLSDNLNLTLARIAQQGSSRASLGMRTLLWLYHARRPHNLLELQHAIGTNSAVRNISNLDLADLEFFVAYTFGLVTVHPDSNIVQFVHQSVNEFIWLHRARLFRKERRVLPSLISHILMIDALSNDHAGMEVEKQESDRGIAREDQSGHARSI